MTPACAHVVGAGLAGLAAAAALAAAGRRVVLYESSGHAGGRCRSYFDEALGCRIDNGNHLLLTGNAGAMRYLDLTGARGTFAGPAAAAFAFVDLADNLRWTLRPNRGRLPWWVCVPARRVPQTTARDYFGALALRGAAPQASVADVLAANGVLYRRLWQPLAVAALNTAAEQGSARLFWRVVAETLGRGGAACRPLLPRQGLSESLVDPALALLRGRGAAIRFGARLRAVTAAAGRVAELRFDDSEVALAPADTAILAVPAAVAGRLVPGLVVPDDYAPIVNAHFRHAAPPDAPPLLGLVGGTAEWIICKRNVLSVTVSAADGIVDMPAERLAALLWRDVAAALRLAPEPLPAARIVKERRATFRATPAQLPRRPGSRTRWPNLLLAGDYVDTGLPATIEGAIRSGFAAAELTMARDPRRDPQVAVRT